MRKSAALLITLLVVVLAFPYAGQSEDKGLSSAGTIVLTSNYKFSHQADSLSEVRRQIIASYQPDLRSSEPVILKKTDTIKRRPAVLANFSDSVFHKKLSARSAIIIDAKTGQEIYSHNPDRPGQPASTIKVLTSLIAIDNLKNNALIPVSSWAASMPRSKVYLRKGKSYYANDLINAVLLASANDASVALAEKIAGSETGFAKMMTRKANELGATKTICKTASGLTAKGQQTTARDLAVIFKEAMEHQEFAGRAKLIKTKTSYGKTLRNHNRALWRITGAQGGKTGYTWAAKQTYVGKFSRDGNEIIVAILGSRNMWIDIDKLVDYGFNKQDKLKMAAREDSQENNPEESSSLESALVVLTDNKKTEKL
jgi:serine-type D-Ala-D-Ala carboxypeptidase (penicillin-binding protein 5/6)